MDPNKDRRHGNISPLMCYFWRGVLGVDEADEALEGEFQPPRLFAPN